ncbi:MAG: DUF2721 domain-containing protein [Burkholderiaceae bacterium]|jgi:hypothetical protein|nr:DUF2721 domain-containing protein [Burkholderiaceae bacterium]
MAAELNTVSHVIQLSVAPVFLLTGIAGLLGVTANRLARIVDRARTVEPRAAAASAAEREHLNQELATLARRARLIYRAIALQVIAALLVCAVIVGLFITAYYAWTPDLTRVVAAVFASAVLALILGLLTFLREVYLATQTLRIGLRP